MERNAMRFGFYEMTLRVEIRRGDAKQIIGVNATDEVIESNGMRNRRANSYRLMYRPSVATGR